MVYASFLWKPGRFIDTSLNEDTDNFQNFYGQPLFFPKLNSIPLTFLASKYTARLDPKVNRIVSLSVACS